jgi:RNA polymerase sigma-70 factor (ECF subfamily)
VLERFAAAFENGDASALAHLLREDVALEMPPLLTWFVGRENVTQFLASQVFTAPERFRMVPVMANGQPAFAAYQLGRDGVYRANEVLVPTVTTSGVARMVVFLNPRLVEMFGLPPEYGAASAGQGRAHDAAITPWRR